MVVEGIIKKNPWVIEGGHVVFSLENLDRKAMVDCAAYEPTKQFRDIVKQLRVGDNMVVYGGVRCEPLTINIEKIRVLSLVNVLEKIENPVCHICNKHMKSIGKDQGFRCKRCRTKSNIPVMHTRKRKIGVGMHEVPVVARRHLSRPLKLIKKVYKY